MEQEEFPAEDIEIEEGELSDGDSEDVYVPLQRPSSTVQPIKTNSAIINSSMKDSLENQCNDVIESSDTSSASSSDSDNSLKNILSSKEGSKMKKKTKKQVQRTVMVRIRSEEDDKKARFKKYNIWAAALEEEALTEDMRGCGVKHNVGDRNVENYDFNLEYRMKGENALKRRLSVSSDDETECQSSKKRRECDGKTSYKREHRFRKPSSSGSNNSYEPRYIEDLYGIDENDPVGAAKEIADKLYEENDELMIRIVEVLGLDLPIEVFKETQRIEADGGMMIMNGARRRTPGGVFLFLLKKHEKLTEEDQKAIFIENRKKFNKTRKKQQSSKRNRKVEELKKRLSEQESELSSLGCRKDLLLLGAELNTENRSGNLSNPPPSPVGNEQCPEFKPSDLNEDVLESNDTQPCTSLKIKNDSPRASDEQKEMVCYDDDFLDVHCTDVEFL